MLKRIFGPKRDEVIGGWRKLHNEEIHNSYSSLIVIRMIKSRMRRPGHLTCREEECIQDFGAKTRKKETIRKI
jgi:hypothetical protein